MSGFPVSARSIFFGSLVDSSRAGITIALCITLKYNHLVTVEGGTSDGATASTISGCRSCTPQPSINYQFTLGLPGGVRQPTLGRHRDMDICVGSHPCS